jgi:hypothetical protein
MATQDCKSALTEVENGKGTSSKDLAAESPQGHTISSTVPPPVEPESAAPRGFDNAGAAENAVTIERCAQAYFEELVRNPVGASLGLCLNDLGLKLTAEAENDLDCFGAELHKRLVELLAMRSSRTDSTAPAGTVLADIAALERAETCIRHAGELLVDRDDPAEWDVSAVQALAEKAAATLREILEDAAEAARPQANHAAPECTGFQLDGSQVRADLADIATLAYSSRGLAMRALESAPPGMGMFAHALQVIAEKIGYLADRHADAPQLVGSYDEWIID